MVRHVRALALAVLAASSLACFKPASPSSADHPVADAGPAAELGDARLVNLASSELVASLALDFGSTLLGAPSNRTVLVRNQGPGEVTITAVTATTPDGAFTLPAPGLTVAAGDQQALAFAFTPTTAGAHAIEITLALSNALLPSLTITATGAGVDATCVLSTELQLDFGNVEVGAATRKQIIVTNGSSLPWNVTIDPIADDADRTFALDNFATGAHLVPAAGSIAIPVLFAPTRARTYSASLHIAGPDTCDSVLTLSGVGVADYLSCAPEAASGPGCGVDFSFSPPGHTVTREVSFANIGPSPIAMSDFAFAGADAAFQLDGAPTTLVVNPLASAVVLRVAFTPPASGSYRDTLSFKTDDPLHPTGTVELAGVGGGPRIEVTPNVIDLGIVLVETKTLTVSFRNVGTDVPDTTEDNLRFASLVSGAWVETAPQVTGGGGSVTVAWPPAGYAATGLAADAPALEAALTFAPTGPGVVNASVTLFSNDLLSPATQVELRADVRAVLPCNLTVTPTALNFSTMEPGLARTLPLTLRNADPSPASECVLSALEMMSGSSPAFTLLAVPSPLPVLHGGEELEVAVRFNPASAGSFTATVLVAATDMTSPLAPVAVSGSASANCLRVAFDDYDFGSVATGCRSPERTFTITNDCSSGMTVTSVAAASGTSSEFVLSALPTLPATVLPQGSKTFKIAYAPVDVGPDIGFIDVQAVGSSAAKRLMVRGRGAATGTQSDTFIIDSKVDLLVIIDDSASMQRIQNALAQNFSAFFQYATAHQVDFHVALTTTSTSSYKPAGKFVPVNGANRIITSSTPNPAQVFAANMTAVGIDGDGDEKLIHPAYLALTNPLLTGANAGFLRPSARLAIFTTTDAAESDPLPGSFYEQFFLSLKGGDRNRFSVSGLIPTQNPDPQWWMGCSYESTGAGLSTFVRTLAQNSNGIIEEVCTTNYAPVFSRLSSALFGFPQRYYLSAPPDPTATSQISVTVNGAAYPAVNAGGVTQWGYNATSNSIELTAAANFVNGDVLTVSYPVACQ